MNTKELVGKLSIYTLSAVHIHDLAISAEKLMSWNKEDWKTPPYLSTGANRPSLSEKELPLCLILSEALSKTIGLISHQRLESNGGSRLFHQDERIPIERVIATQIILYNYCLLEEFEFFQFNTLLALKIIDLSNDKFTLSDFVNRGFDDLCTGIISREQAIYERKGVRKRILEWEKVVINKLTDENLDIYENLSNRRNELTHQSEPEPPTIKEAVINFYLVRKIGIEIGKCFNDPSVNEIDFPPLINEIHNE